MDGAACCKCGGAQTPNQPSRCFRCHRPLHSSCCPVIEWYSCCDACLLQANSRDEEQVPPWVRDLVAPDFSALCRNNRFCPTCLFGFCGRRCLAAHEHAGGQGADAIQIHVLGEGDSLRAFVDVMEVVGLCDCSEIQLEMDLAPAPRLLRQLVPLHPAKCRSKKYCGSVRIGDERLYCSMECEWQQGDKCRPSNQFVKALLAEDFITGHRRDAFCIDCRVAFCTAVRTDHARHRFVEIISNGGRFFARVPATAKWLGNFALVPEDGEGYRLLPLAPPPQNSC